MGAESAAVQSIATSAPLTIETEIAYLRQQAEALRQQLSSKNLQVDLLSKVDPSQAIPITTTSLFYLGPDSPVLLSLSGVNPKILFAIALQNSDMQVHILRDEDLVGRNQGNALCISDPKVSRHHLKIAQNSMGQFCILDLNSTNGTFFCSKDISLDFNEPSISFEFKESNHTSSGQTSVGIVRDHNEDSLTHVEAVSKTKKVSLYIVADGMGGHQAGEIASGMASSETSEKFVQNLKETSDTSTILVQAIKAANEKIFKHRRGNMGTTIAAVALENYTAHIAHVGDSSVFIFRDQETIVQTVSHTMINEWVDAGILTKEQAKVHPRRNVITRALGVKTAVVVDTSSHQVQQNDTIVLFSDGLMEHVSEAEINKITSQYPPQEATQKLITLANERGGTDNITVIVIKIT